MMQQGTPVDDLLYFYGENVPSFVRLKADDPARVLPGYDYDVTDEDALLHTIRLEGNMLIGPSGVHWRALALPKNRRLSLPALERIATLARDGTTIIGLPPVSPIGRVSAQEGSRFATIVREVWGDECQSSTQHSYGKGTGVCTADSHAALLAIHVLPDVELAAGSDQAPGAHSDSALDYIHRRIGRTDVYFIRNGSGADSNHQILLRSENRTVERWDPVTEEMHRLTAVRQIHDGRIEIPLTLPPYGSAFLIISSEASPRMPAPHIDHSELLAPQDGWRISFQPGRGVPPTELVMQDLRSWTVSSNPGVRYFSGTATYRANVEAPVHTAHQQVLLQFSDVREIARIRVNGHDAGTVWARPLTVRVDQWLRRGPNTLEIEVTNLWPNRIIGDLQPCVLKTFTKTNIKAYRADSPLPPSGLIGPVRWIIQK